MNLEFIDLYPKCIITTKVPTSSAELLKIKIFKYRLYSRPHIEKWSFKRQAIQAQWYNCLG